MKNLVGILMLGIGLTAGLFGQTASLSGTVSDPSGAVIPSAVVTVVNTETGLQREDKSDSQGRYTMDALPPGTYKLTAKAAGFADTTVNGVRLFVNQPATVAVVFEKVGSTSTTVAVEAYAAQLNTQDASLGNAIVQQTIVELPSFARNVANLLQFQPGVTNFGTNNSQVSNNNPTTIDDRNGSVNGGRSDQGNITLDGVDVNNQSTRAAFTSVLRVTPDSVEEFRSTTSNGDASKGRASGADIALVTKSGTNELHGALYEYRRGTETAANDFFSNRSGVPIAPLNINIFGAAVHGPIKKNKAFFFANYEGRRDASSSIVNRTVPTETLKQGIVQFHNTAGQIVQVTPDQLKGIDPLGIGVDPAALDVMQAVSQGEQHFDRRPVEHHRIHVQRSGARGPEYLHREVGLQRGQQRQEPPVLARQSAKRQRRRHAAVPGRAAQLGDAGQQQGSGRRLDQRVDAEHGQFAALRLHPRGRRNHRNSDRSLRQLPRLRYDQRNQHGNVAHRSGAQRLRGPFVEQGRARFALRRPGSFRLEPLGNLQPLVQHRHHQRFRAERQRRRHHAHFARYLFGRPHQLSVRDGRAARPGHFGDRQLQLPGGRHRAARRRPGESQLCQHGRRAVCAGFVEGEAQFHRDPRHTLRPDAAGARSGRTADLYRPADWRLVR